METGEIKQLTEVFLVGRIQENRDRKTSQPFHSQVGTVGHLYLLKIMGPGDAGLPLHLLGTQGGRIASATSACSPWPASGTDEVQDQPGKLSFKKKVKGSWVQNEVLGPVCCPSIHPSIKVSGSL